MVGGFIEQQHVGLGQQQTAQRHAALLAAGQIGDLRFPWRQAQRVGRHFELLLQHMRIVGCQDGFKARLCSGQLVEIGVRLAVGGVDLVQLGLRGQHLADAFFHRLAHVVLGVEPRLLFQVTDLDIRLCPRLALEVGIDAGHDPQHGRFAGAVQAQQADLGAGEKAQRDVLDDLAFRRHGLADADHGVDVLHGALRGNALAPARAQSGTVESRRR
jgi:hypothetical protein